MSEGMHEGDRAYLDQMANEQLDEIEDLLNHQGWEAIVPPDVLLPELDAIHAYAPEEKTKERIALIRKKIEEKLQ